MNVTKENLFEYNWNIADSPKTYEKWSSLYPFGLFSIHKSNVNFFMNENLDFHEIIKLLNLIRFVSTKTKNVLEGFNSWDSRF